MMQFVWICLGGAVGTGARYLVALGAARLLGAGFPYGTLAVNCAGSFLMSIVMSLHIDAGILSPSTRMILATGFLGGFTTYSAFNYETLALLQSGAYALALTNILVTLLGCGTAGALGFVVAARVVG